MPEKLYKASELAPLFGIKSDTLYKWHRRGKLPIYKVEDSRTIRFKKSDVQRVFKQMNRESPSAASL